MLIERHGDGVGLLRELWGLHATVLTGLGRAEEAVALARRYQERVIEEDGRDTFSAGHATHDLAYAVHDLPAPANAEAEALYREAARMFEAALGPVNEWGGMAYHNLALFLETAGRLDEAEASSRRSLELRRATLGDDDPNTLSSLRGLAGIRGTQRAHADAAALYRDYVTRASLVLGPASVQVQRARLPLARMLWRAGRQAEAEAALDEAEAFLPEMHDPEAFRAQVARARATIAGDPSVFD